MKRHFRVLAATSFLGLQVTTGLGGLAMAQSELPTVTITGKRGSDNGGSDCWPNCQAYSGGSSSGSSSGGIPENEAVSVAQAPSTNQLADEAVKNARLPCIKAGESINAWLNRAVEACTPQVMVATGLSSGLARQACIARKTSLSEALSDGKVGSCAG